MKDIETHQVEWVPAKVSSVEISDDSRITKFTVHVVVERQEERGVWVDEYKPGLSAL